MISFLGSYRKYDDVSILGLIDTIQNLTFYCATTARIKHMPKQTAQEYVARFRDGEEYLSSQKRTEFKRPLLKLLQENTKAVIEFYDNDATATIKQAQELVWNRFNIALTQSGLQKHLISRCGLTMKNLKKYQNLATPKKQLLHVCDGFYGLKKNKLILIAVSL